MTVDIFNTENRYDLILADPPWKQSKGGKKSVRANSSGRPLDYQVCTLEEIEEHLKAAVSLTGGEFNTFPMDDRQILIRSAGNRRTAGIQTSRPLDMEQSNGHSRGLYRPIRPRIFTLYV